MRMILRVVANQFRRPTGVLGHLWGAVMNRGNARMIAGTVDALDVQPKHQVLEIGFGGGASIDLLLELTSEGHVVGTELSEILLAQARRRFADAIHHRRLDLVSAPVEMLPFENARFDRVCTINTIYFWTDPLRGMNEIYRVLRPGGRFVLGMRPAATLQRFPFTRYGFVLYETTKAESLLARAGFHEVRVELHKDKSIEYICTVGGKALP